MSRTFFHPRVARNERDEGIKHKPVPVPCFTLVLQNRRNSLLCLQSTTREQSLAYTTEQRIINLRYDETMMDTESAGLNMNKSSADSSNNDWSLVDVTAEQSLSLGDAAYVDEQYEEALTDYTAASTLVSNNNNNSNSSSLVQFRIWSHRSAALFQLGRYDEAWNDAKMANTLMKETTVVGLRSGESEICLRREGQAAYKLGNFDAAHSAFQKASQLALLNQQRSSSTFSYEDFIQRCQAHLPSIAEGKVKESTVVTATVDDVKPAAKSVPPTVKLTPAVPRSTAAVSSTKILVPKYQYYQSDKVMTISILEPRVKETDLAVHFEAESLSVKLTKQGQEFTVLAGTLYETVLPDQCLVSIRDDKVLIKLRKSSPGEWYTLLSKNKKKTVPTTTAEATTTTASSTATTTTPPPQPSSTAPLPAVSTVDTSKPRPYSSPRDWDTISKQLAEEEDKETPDGDGAMNKLFQQIYASADEDTKRAMIKSYQTSGGTVLSTNWKEVKEKDYEEERTAPKGMEWKTWEGDKLPMKDDD